MTWKNDHLYGVAPLEFERLRRLADLDHGPGSFLDEDRAERWSDYEPARLEAAPASAHILPNPVTPASALPSSLASSRFVGAASSRGDRKAA